MPQLPSATTLGSSRLLLGCWPTRWKADANSGLIDRIMTERDFRVRCAMRDGVHLRNHFFACPCGTHLHLAPFFGPDRQGHLLRSAHLFLAQELPPLRRVLAGVLPPSIPGLEVVEERPADVCEE